MCFITQWSEKYWGIGEDENGLFSAGFRAHTIDHVGAAAEGERDGGS